MRLLLFATVWPHCISSCRVVSVTSALQIVPLHVTMSVQKSSNVNSRLWKSSQRSIRTHSLDPHRVCDRAIRPYMPAVVFPPVHVATRIRSILSRIYSRVFENDDPGPVYSSNGGSQGDAFRRARQNPRPNWVAAQRRDEASAVILFRD